jgi:NAD(P)-dependent dehydrogenase (short-subunit alcohol dehydrogenase family)
MVEEAVAQYGKLNIVVNNAGILRDRALVNTSPEDWAAVIGVHLTGTFNVTHHAASYWRAEHKRGNALNGRVINTTSDAGLLGNFGQSAYGAAKAGVVGLTNVWAIELKPYGVTVNAIAPAARTRMTTDATPKFAELVQGDRYDPENIAPLVCVLASDAAADITGKVFRVLGASVWPLAGWRGAGRVTSHDGLRWDPAALTPALLAELAKGLTEREDLLAALSEG